MNYRYLLFDLDGTLLPMEPERFIKAYMKTIARRVEPYIKPQEFIQSLLAATEAMVCNEVPHLTNKEVFMEDFFKRISLPPEKIMPIFEAFYEEDFPELIQYTQPSPLPRQIMKQALDKGYRLVIASNPVFPLRAMVERMRWAGIDEFPYELITSYEIMHFCKPRSQYYTEIVEKIGAVPEECLMIGNDVVEDLVAAEVGVHTCLVEDCLINPDGREISCHYRTSLEGLLGILKNIKGS